jgi:hypothetical protein
MEDRMPSLGRDEWVKLIAEFEAGDLSQPEFAAQRQVSVYALRFWLYKFRLESKKSTRFLPVSVVASAAPTARDAATEWMEATLPSGVVLRFAVGTDSRYLAQLFAASA